MMNQVTVHPDNNNVKVLHDYFEASNLNIKKKLKLYDKIITLFQNEIFHKNK